MRSMPTKGQYLGKGLLNGCDIRMAFGSCLNLVLHMQATGTYISRSLSYSGAEFSIIRVEVDPVFKVNIYSCMLLLVIILM